jgi:hypothetical protein
MPTYLSTTDVFVYDEAGNVIETHEPTHMFTKRLTVLRIAIEKRRETLRRFRWLRPLLNVLDCVILIVDLFIFPFGRLLRLLLGIGFIGANSLHQGLFGYLSRT